MSAMSSQSPASRWFAQQFVQAQIKENINASVTGEFPSQGASNAENVSIWWRDYVPFLESLSPTLFNWD